ncbi:MAG TPA: protein-L-isoaspartate(D-aspartate) O-methyltransferase [Polyangiaceae bacterium]|nr:protein-L-isoaspartate(D-aspartate) O-methyltransferase [Polyangiaceae bacterium]
MHDHQVLDCLHDLELEQRQGMIREQLVARGIHEHRVLSAMEQVPRHLFVPEELRDQAYAPCPLPIGFGQAIAQPYMVALALQALGLKGHERVLEVGAGSGYQAALLGLLAREVYSLEIVPELACRASEMVRSLGFDNVHVVQTDGTLGHAAAAPYDAIIVAASAPEVPSELLAQLAPGGCLVVPVGDDSRQLLMRLRMHPGSVESETLAVCKFVPMTGAIEEATEVPWAESSRAHS